MMLQANILRKFTLPLILLVFTFMTANVFAENKYRPKSTHVYITGPKGGCYYINKNGKKTYVDRALCR